MVQKLLDIVNPETGQVGKAVPSAFKSVWEPRGWVLTSEYEAPEAEAAPEVVAPLTPPAPDGETVARNLTQSPRTGSSATSEEKSDG